MRLLYVADPFLPVPPTHYGGIERIVAATISGAIEAGHEVALLAHPASQIPGARLYPLRGGASPGLKDLLINARRVQLAVQEFRPDLLHSFARLALLGPVLASSLPKIMSYQREPTARTVRWASRLAGSSLTFTGCSESITHRGQVLGGSWESIPNGVDLGRYAFRAHVPPDAPLVFLSRIERVKGAHRAIAAARASGRNLILAGSPATSGPKASYWRNEIAPHLGRDGIAYAGALDDSQKSALLGSALALIVPIEWEEPFGIVFIESLACGTPVLSCPRGALPEIVEHGREGFLCEDLEELTEAIGKVAGLRRLDCRKKVEERFSTAQMCVHYQRLYARRVSLRQKVCSAGGRGRI